MTGKADRLLLAAAAVGVVHAAFSLYWAVGGRWLLGTVGQWAVELAAEQPITAGIALGGIAALKAAGAALPVLASRRRVRWPWLWRGMAWPGSILLIVYGGVNTVVATFVLAGGIHPAGGYDREAMIGHALVWDPLFLIWGLLLASGLFASHRQASTVAAPTRHAISQGRLR